MAYITPLAITKLSGHSNGVYATLHIMARAAKESPETRITRLSTETNWTQVWKNLHTAWGQGETKSNWYVVVHEIIPINE
jgi:hypothetical protein